MLPDRVSNPGPLTYESGALPIALRGPFRDLIYILELAHFVRCSRLHLKHYFLCFACFSSIFPCFLCVL